MIGILCRTYLSLQLHFDFIIFLLFFHRSVPHLWILYIIICMSSTLSFVCALFTCFTEPGSISHIPQLKFPHDPSASSAALCNSSTQSPDLPSDLTTFSYCHRCSILLPSKAHHSFKSNACFLQYDHYCSFFQKDIAIRNHLVFLLYCIFSFFTCFVILSFFIVYRDFPRYNYTIPFSGLIAGHGLVLLLVLHSQFTALSVGITTRELDSSGLHSIRGKVRLSFPWSVPSFVKYPDRFSLL
ncbi:hypothetical protein GEMRC1_004812 [Eukaryota sp. GEM-RC1]